MGAFFQIVLQTTYMNPIYAIASLIFAAILATGVVFWIVTNYCFVSKRKSVINKNHKQFFNLK